MSWQRRLLFIREMQAICAKHGDHSLQDVIEQVKTTGQHTFYIDPKQKKKKEHSVI